ncbi:MAG: hypothetical protein JWQ53_297 [Klenkia sp.]|nr:hypothetical protein [Klenkia sp.]
MSTPTGGQPPQGPWDPRNPPGPQGPPPWAGQVARGQGPVGPLGAPKPPQSGLAKLLVPIALVVAALSVVGLFLISQGSVAEVGDCVSRGDDDSISTVDCSSADADYRVAGAVEDARSFQAESACLGAFPESTAFYFEGTSGEAGTILCLTGV